MQGSDVGMTNEELKALKPDMLTPAEITAKAEGLALTKVNMPPAKAFVAAMLAGAFISFGAMYFCLFQGDPDLSFAVQRFVGALCFCLGLVLVLCCGAELFTGNTLMSIAKANKKISWGQMLKSWAIVWLGNLVGALVIVFLVYMSNMQGMNDGLVGEAMVNAGASKAALPWVTAFFKGIVCNALVCLAVWMGFSARTVVDKFVAVLFPISGFVACGYEHCVANMFFLPMSFLLNKTGVGEPGAIDMMGILSNLSAATLGNIVGGAILVGLAYWFLYGRK